MSVRSSSSVSTLDGLRVETVRHQWDDVLRQDEVLGLPEDDQAVFVDGGAGCVDVGDVDILLVRASTISGAAESFTGMILVVPVDPLEALGPVGEGGELGVRGHLRGPPQPGQVGDRGQSVLLDAVVGDGVGVLVRGRSGVRHCQPREQGRGGALRMESVSVAPVSLA